jgi:hypothetical protein
VAAAGAGSNDLLGKKRQTADQKMTGRNQAMLVNIALGIPVRVVRKNEDPYSFHGCVFVYDGLYDVVSAGLIFLRWDATLLFLRA